MDEEILEALEEVRKEMSKFTIEKILSPNYSQSPLNKFRGLSCET